MEGEKISPSGTDAILATSAVPPGGGGRERLHNFLIFPGGFVVLFIISLVSEERIPKRLRQVSIVGSAL